MVRRWIAWASVLLLLGCASGRPTEFLLADNQLTYDQGEQLIRDGDALISEADMQIADGKRIRENADRWIEDGKERRKRGEALKARGQKALDAALLLEKAETHRREGEQLKVESAPQ